MHIVCSSIVKKIIVASFYLKPHSKKKSALFDHISQVYHALSAKYVSGLYWAIAGDRNEFQIDNILSLCPDFKQLVDRPTRLSPPRILDVIVTNMAKFYNAPTVEDPLEPDSVMNGAPSDHLMVVLSPRTNFQNKRGRNLKNIEFRPLTDDGYIAMTSVLDTWDWSYLVGLSSANDQMESFQDNLYQIFDKCFPLKRRKVFTEIEPWFNDRLEKLKRQKCR